MATLNPRDPALIRATLDEWKEMRQRSRTDLLFLCNEVLGYPDVCRDVHGPMIDCLQHFQGGTDYMDYIKGGWQGYYPACTPEQLKGHRRNLILMSRGTLKTTCATLAHSIQWIINYPDIRILLSSGTGDQVRKFLDEIKKHFQYNEVFRWLFPEYCPPPGKNSAQFGNQEQFTVPCRKKHRKEPTVSVISAESVIAGGHYEVIKNDDLVDKENVKTPDQIAKIKSHFGLMRPLLELIDQHWIDILGTVYHSADLHWALVKAQNEQRKEDHQWHILLCPACEDYPNGKLLWPERISLQALKNIENDPTLGPEVLYTQYLLKPVPSSSGLVESEKELLWIPRSELNNLYPRLRLHATIDLAGMDASTSDTDYSVLNLHGFDGDGRLYILEILRSRTMGHDKFIDAIFDLHTRHPRLFDIKMQKDLLARVLLPAIKREEVKRQHWLPLVPVPLPTARNAKVNSIKRLQPWMKNGTIRFAADLSCKHALIEEIMEFPKSAHDDILDTISMTFTGREGQVNLDVLPLGGSAGDIPLPAREGEYVAQKAPATAALDKLIWPEDIPNSAVCDRTGW